jgi:hypothetical protein
MTTIDAHDVRPGDIIYYHGRHHRIDHVDRREGWAWPVAFDGAGWAMALGGHVVITRRAA